MDIFTSGSQGRKLFSFAIILVLILYPLVKVSAQPPACGIMAINGQLNSCTGQQVSFNSNVAFGNGASYNWEFPVNNTGAFLVTGQGTPAVEVNVGALTGQFTLRLNVVTPGGSTSCETSFTVQGLELQPSFTPLDCFGSTSTLTVTSNGTNVTYTLLPMNISNTTGIFPGLTAGNYEIVATEEISDCSASAVIVIPQPGNSLISSSVVQDNRCFGQGEGSIDLTVTGGVAPYTYEWTASNGGMIPPGQMNNQDLINLFVGDYSVTITDAAGCTQVHQATIAQPAQLLAQASTTHVICWGMPTGAIDLTITGGTPPYSYLWTGSWGGIIPAGMESSEDLSGLTPGFYEVLVKDANNCSVSKSISLNGPSIGLATSYTQTNVECTGGATGAIDLNVSNGVPPFTYLWTASNGGIIPPGQETVEDLSGLVPGTYTCLITDSINCITTREITIIQTGSGPCGGPLPCDLNVTGDFTNVSCFGQEDGSISLAISGGSSPYTVSWSATNGGSIPAGQQNALQLTGLLKGTYNYTVSSADGCSVTGTVNVSGPDEELTISETHTNVACGNGTASIDITVTGGTAPYTYLWNSLLIGSIPPGQANNEDITGLTAGIYFVRVMDANGCSRTKFVMITNVFSDIHIHGEITHPACAGSATGAINISPSGGNGSYTFQWSASDGGIVPPGQELNEDLSGLVAGKYKVVATDANGCSKTRTFTLHAHNPFHVHVHKQNVQGCNEDNGSIEISLPNAGGPYTFTWVSSNGGIIPAGQQNQQNLSNLVAGTYTVSIQNNAGCTVVKEVVITEHCFQPVHDCGHGYWKNHTQHWNQFTDPVVSSMPQGLQFITTTNFHTYFGLNGVSGLPADLTMHEALQLSGGNNCRGLARSAVKALLVIASGQNVTYPPGTSNFSQVYSAIRNALINGNCTGNLRHQLDHLCNSNDDDDDDDDGRAAQISQLEVTASPNPFISELRFNVHSESQGIGSLELFGLTGERLAVIYQGEISPKQVITYRVPEKMKRSMVYVLRMGNQVRTGKLLFLN